MKRFCTVRLFKYVNLLMLRFQSYKGKNDIYPGISMKELNPLEKKTRLASDEKVITFKVEHFNLLIIHIS